MFPCLIDRSESLFHGPRQCLIRGVVNILVERALANLFFSQPAIRKSQDRLGGICQTTTITLATLGKRGMFR